MLVGQYTKTEILERLASANVDYYFRKVVPKNYFKHNGLYVLNNMTQMLYVSKNSNIKYSIIQVN